MIHETFAVYDSKAGAFLPPFILPRVEMAQRVFSDCVNSDQHQFAAHPDDYTLFQLGSFDDESGKFTPRKNGKLSLGNGIEYMDLKHQAAPPEGKANGQKVSDDPSILPGTESGDSPQ